MADPFDAARQLAAVLRELPENVRDEVVALAMAHVAPPVVASGASMTDSGTGTYSLTFRAIRKDVAYTEHGLHSGDEYP